MSDAIYTLDAEVRTDLGKGASRRLRHEDKVPAIIYGGHKDALSITLEHSKLLKAQSFESFYSHILTLNVGKEKIQAIVKDMQRHPFKPKIMHVDFQRVEAGHELHTTVPLHFLNEDVAIKKGGVVVHGANEVEINVLPKDLPEFIEVDLSNVEIGQTLHLSDLVAPKGVTFTQLSKGEGHDLAVVSVNKPAGKAVDADEGDAAESAE
ncbi:50S ribosomal protein L25/general stress protein Ctc [Alkalimonas sp. MEB108]|uniref:Large ribosomal subunit protein bL25 n=1 Tax=Alkalimonas cellulosilytica TaxID=3058395 RepID=A0ABU7J998_9GAMM|nr:50S ribosomal protein L25/general stress protein Ctc [Alkalimonas sp. MEB108]MEE2003121.1 50S ribosomal protein L25/general stress protein Ctc [Alkalimonas sp. MEB108]